MVLISILPTAVLAQDQEIVNRQGLIIENTQTTIGKSFYRQFVSIWEPPRNAVDFNIFVQERADARWGSIISIFINDRLMYRNILAAPLRQPKRSRGRGG